MPTAITPKPAFDPAAAASNLPPSLQWLGGALGSVAKDVTGAGDPNTSVMGVGNPMMAADTELSPLAKALYSRVDKIASALPEWLHPAKALSIFKNNTSKEEMEHRGLAQLLTERQGPDKISKVEILGHLEKNPPPQVGVKTLSNPQTGNVDAYASRTQYNRPDLNLPGGKNYTESLFTLNKPTINSSERDELKKEVESLGLKWETTNPANLRHRFNRPDLADRLRDFIMNQDVNEPTYTSSHWDTPNVLAHTREDIRPDASGQTGKFLQEVQSDWHQAGKNEGYKLTELPPGYKLNKQGDQYYVNGYGFLAHPGPTPEIATENALRRLNEPKVPDAPFKDSWPDLTLKKHVLDVANSPDQQWLGFTKGATQADRYNLAHHISSVGYNPGTQELWFSKPDGGAGGAYYNISPDKIKDYIGHELSQKLLSQPQDPTSSEHLLQGLDLNMGGEGMKHFYDQVLPSRLNKILKPFGGSVEEGQLPGKVVKPQYLTHFNENVGTHQIVNNQNQPLASVWPPTQVDPHTPIDNLGDLLSTESGRKKFKDLRDQAMNGLEKAQDLKADLIRRDTTQDNIPMWLARLTPEMKAAIQKAGLPLMTLLLSRQLDKQNALINPSGQGQ